MADVPDGAPDRRDPVLAAEERAAGDTMTVCVARCRGAHLVAEL
ncbi:hypothetical protein [Streptomyces sp. PTD9-10]